MRPWFALALLLLAGPAGAQTLQRIVTGVWVHDVPGPPEGQFWDPVGEHLLSTFTNPTSVYPDVMICARPATVATPHCSKICWDLKGDTHSDGKTRSTECQQPLHVPLMPGDPRMVLEVLEMDHDGDGARVHAIIARNVAVGDPSQCTEDKPCKWSTSRGALVLSFNTEAHGVLGTPAPSSPSPAPTQSGSATPITGSPLWQQAVNAAKKAREGAQKAAHQYVDSKDPTASSSSQEIAQRGAALTQSAINSCLTAIAHNDDILRSRMPACTNLSGKLFEDCMYSNVLYDNNIAISQGYACSRQYQGEADTLGGTGVYVWLKGQVCGIGQWIGLRVCQ